MTPVNRAMRWVAFTLAGMLAGMFVVVGHWIVEEVTADRRVPIHITGIEALNSPVRAGEHLRVKVTRKKTRACPLTSIRWVVDADGRKYAAPGEAGKAGGPVDTESVTIDYPMPRDLKPGQHIFYTRLYFHCSDGIHVVDHPPLPFRVRL